MTAVMLVLWLLVAVVVLAFLAVVTLLVYGLVQLMREVAAEMKTNGVSE
ncbi:hypothetical protein [Nocardia sp. NPDC060249]